MTFPLDVLFIEASAKTGVNVNEVRKGGNAVSSF